MGDPFRHLRHLANYRERGEWFEGDLYLYYQDIDSRLSGFHGRKVANQGIGTDIQYIAFYRSDVGCFVGYRQGVWAPGHGEGGVV